MSDDKETTDRQAPEAEGGAGGPEESRPGKRPDEDRASADTGPAIDADTAHDRAS